MVDASLEREWTALPVSPLETVIEVGDGESGELNGEIVSEREL